MSNIYDWSKNADDNGDIDSDMTWREGMMPSQVNNSARMLMKRIRDNATDLLFCREPVKGANNLRVTLDEDFKDYVDGMIVRFRCQNDIGAVPENPLLCLTNIPVDKRGNNGDGLPMVMLTYDTTAKEIRIKRAITKMFGAGAHITAVFSKIHHIWEDAAYQDEQKAKKHLAGDFIPLLKTDPEWEKYKNDIGVFFVSTDSNVAEMQDIIERNLSCMPKLDAAKITDDVTPVGIMKASDKGDCMKLVTIGFPSSIANSKMYDAPIDVEIDVPERATHIEVKLQGAGGAGGVYDHPERAPYGGDSEMYVDGTRILLATGGQSGLGIEGGLANPTNTYPFPAAGGVGKVIDENWIYETKIINHYSGSGKPDWLESTRKNAGGLGSGGQSVGALGRPGQQTGCFNGQGISCSLTPEQVQIQWNSLCGVMGGGAGGGNVTGCQWGSGGGAGGYAHVILQVTGKDGRKMKKIRIKVGAGAKSLGAEPKGQGGDGYCEISW